MTAAIHLPVDDRRYDARAGGGGTKENRPRGCGQTHLEVLAKLRIANVGAGPLHENILHQGRKFRVAEAARVLRQATLVRRLEVIHNHLLEFYVLHRVCELLGHLKADIADDVVTDLSTALDEVYELLPRRDWRRLPNARRGHLHGRLDKFCKETHRAHH